MKTSRPFLFHPMKRKCPVRSPLAHLPPLLRRQSRRKRRHVVQWNPVVKSIKWRRTPRKSLSIWKFPSCKLKWQISSTCWKRLSVLFSLFFRFRIVSRRRIVRDLCASLGWSGIGRVSNVRLQLVEEDLERAERTSHSNDTKTRRSFASGGRKRTVTTPFSDLRHAVSLDFSGRKGLEQRTFQDWRTYRHARTTTGWSSIDRWRFWSQIRWSENERGPNDVLFLFRCSGCSSYRHHGSRFGTRWRSCRSCWSVMNRLDEIPQFSSFFPFRKILELEEELKVVGNNMKSLEVSEQEVRHCSMENSPSRHFSSSSSLGHATWRKLRRTNSRLDDSSERCKLTFACTSSHPSIDHLGRTTCWSVWTNHGQITKRSRSSRRRITCRKGEIQGRQRRTRHDIERIVGLLNQLVHVLWKTNPRESTSFFFLSPLLSIIPIWPWCDFVCALEWTETMHRFSSSISSPWLFFLCDKPSARNLFSSLLFKIYHFMSIYLVCFLSLSLFIFLSTTTNSIKQIKDKIYLNSFATDEENPRWFIFFYLKKTFNEEN